MNIYQVVRVTSQGTRKVVDMYVNVKDAVAHAQFYNNNPRASFYYEIQVAQVKESFK